MARFLGRSVLVAWLDRWLWGQQEINNAQVSLGWETDLRVLFWTWRTGALLLRFGQDLCALLAANALVVHRAAALGAAASFGLHDERGTWAGSNHDDDPLI